MAVNDISNSNQNTETINREIKQEPRREQRQESNNKKRQNNNGILLACSLLAGASLSRNNNVFVNQQETQQRNFATEFIQSAIQIFNNEKNIVNPDDQVVFSTNDINTGISYTYSGGNSIDIISNGIYQIIFVANISGTADGQTARFVIVENETEIMQSQIIQSVDNNQTYGITTNAIIKVTALPTNIYIKNNGTDAIEISNANLTINKISN